MPSVSQVTSIRTNINSFGGEVIAIPGSNKIRERVGSSNLGGFGDNSIEQFLKDMSELNQYKTAKICMNAAGIIEEYINKFRSNSSDVVSITKDGEEVEYSKNLNDLFRAINFDKAFFEDKLHEYVYFGSQLMLIRVPTNGSISDSELENLKYPFSSIVFATKDSKDYYVNGERLNLKGDGFFYLPLRIGKLDLELEETTNSGVVFDGNLIQEHSWKASMPLFYGLVTDLKLFILKDVLTHLIQIQDIVAPNLLLANVDKSTSQEKATELAEQIEKLINQYGDLTQLISSNADITTLSQFILNNVRVYPDMMGAIKGTDKLDFSRLTGKNQEIRSELDTTETQLVNAIGLPIDLYRGNATNKYDAINQSDRLQARVGSEMTTIDESIVQFCIDYLKSIGKYERGMKIESKLFDYTFLNGITSNYKYNASNQFLKNLTQLAKDIEQAVTETKDIFDVDKLTTFLTDNAEVLYPGFKDLLRKDYIEKLKEEPKNEFDMPSDY